MNIDGEEMSGGGVRAPADDGGELELEEEPDEKEGGEEGGGC